VVTGTGVWRNQTVRTRIVYIISWGNLDGGIRF